MLPKQRLAAILTNNHTYLIHTDMTWGRYKNYRFFAKGMKIKNREAQLSLEDGTFIAANFNSPEDAFTYVGADFHSNPEFDLKSLRAWANYVLD